MIPALDRKGNRLTVKPVLGGARDTEISREITPAKFQDQEETTKRTYPCPGLDRVGVAGGSPLLRNSLGGAAIH